MIIDSDFYKLFEMQIVLPNQCNPQIFTIAKYLGEIEITINCPSVSLQQTG